MQSFFESVDASFIKRSYRTAFYNLIYITEGKYSHEVELTVGKSFIAPAGTMHALRSDGDLYVTAFLVPVVEERTD